MLKFLGLAGERAEHLVLFQYIPSAAALPCTLLTIIPTFRTKLAQLTD